MSFEQFIGNAFSAALVGGFSTLIITFIFSKKKTETELMRKVKANDINSCLKLLDEGADIDALDEKGATALIYAVLNTNPDLVKLLVDRGAGLNIATKKGVSAESIAKNNNLLEIIKILNESKKIKKSFWQNLF